MMDVHDRLSRLAHRTPPRGADALLAGARERARRSARSRHALVAAGLVAVAVAVIVGFAVVVPFGSDEGGGIATPTTESAPTTTTLPDQLLVPACSAPGGTNTIPALDHVQQFFSAAIAGTEPPPLHPDVASQLDTAREAPTIERFTVESHAESTPDQVEVCARTYQRLDGVLHVSTDTIVTIATADGWRIDQWRRGEPQLIRHAGTIRVPFYPHGAACTDRNFVIAEVEIDLDGWEQEWEEAGGGLPLGPMQQAVSEVLSGPVGRIDATTAIPPDVRGYGLVPRSAGLDRPSIDITVLDTAQRLDECQSAAAHDQIIEVIRLILEDATEPSRAASTDINLFSPEGELLSLGQNAL